MDRSEELANPRVLRTVQRNTEIFIDTLRGDCYSIDVTMELPLSHTMYLPEST